MNAREAINRGFNLLCTAIVALSGFAFMPEVFLEKDMPDKVDDSSLFVLAIVAMTWYTHKNNRFTRSVVPVVLVGLALVAKIGAIIVELDDAEAVGDDFGGLILLVLALSFVGYQYWKNQKLLAEAKP